MLSKTDHNSSSKQPGRQPSERGCPILSKGTTQLQGSESHKREQGHHPLPPKATRSQDTQHLLLGPHFHRNIATSNCPTPCSSPSNKNTGERLWVSGQRTTHHTPRQFRVRLPFTGTTARPLPFGFGQGAWNSCHCRCYERWGDQTPWKPTCFLFYYMCSLTVILNEASAVASTAVAPHVWADRLLHALQRKRHRKPGFES